MRGYRLIYIALAAGVAACASNEANTADSPAVTGPDTSAIQGAGSVPAPPPAAVDTLRDTVAGRKSP